MRSGLIKLFCLILLAATPAYAQKPVEIVSGIPIVGSGGQIGLGISNILNEVQKEREYRFSHIQGAQGDTAMLRAVSLARNGNDILYYGGISSVTFNRIQNQTPGLDRDNDFVLSYGIGKNFLGILVNANSPINNIDDLVKNIKSKPKAYFATTLTAPASIMLNGIFTKKYGLSNVDQINYKSTSEIIFAVENKEADYTLFTVPDMQNLKAVLVSSDQRLVTFPNAPTGKEIGFNEFNLSSILLFAVPREKGELLKQFEADMKKACVHPDFEKVAKLRAPYLSYCMEPKDTIATVKNELDFINKTYK